MSRIFKKHQKFKINYFLSENQTFSYFFHGALQRRSKKLDFIKSQKVSVASYENAHNNFNTKLN